MNDDFTVLLLNSRSLLPKINSCITLMDEMEADITCIMETWLSTEDQPVIKDLEDRTEYGFFTRERQGKKGGGVAMIYNRNHITMTRSRIPNTKHEIIAAVGRRRGQRRKVVVINTYVPPTYTAEENKGCLGYICDLIATMKTRYSDPYIYI